MRFILAIISTLLFCTASLAGTAPVTMTFDIPATLDPSEVWVTFVNTNGHITGTYKDTTGASNNLELNTSYSLAQMTSPTSLNGAPANTPAVSLESYESGRVYVSIGAQMTDLVQGQQPVANNINDSNYYKRYQYFEPTVKLNGDGDTCLWVDLSYIDFTSISLSLEMFNATTAANSPQKTQACSTALVKAAASTAETGQNNVRPTTAGIPPDTNFARVVAPNINGDYYHDWTYLLQTVLPGNVTHIKGLFAGVGSGPWADPTLQQQTYDFDATFDAGGGVTLVANTGSGNGRAACIPTSPVDLQGDGIGDDVSIRIEFSEMNAIYGIWGNNPKYTVTQDGVEQPQTAGITNDVYGWIVGDLMAGTCFGFVGSTTDFNGTAIGDMDSADWWGGVRTDGTRLDTANTPAGQDIVFEEVQSDERCYHNYAATLLHLTPAYGFPLQDRLDKNLMTYNAWTDQNAYMQLTINPDTVAIPPVYLLLQ
ncbi:beta-1,3-glucanase family protein [Pseudodesulfovibrio senegalensis]|uniref:GH64 domain-containing protein n=1 Tax=Pseudodesulfovibrio senegalensis TaxID=1721087 RepID=A0A6N6N3X4_9BACT|nr:beta-1,3-glucanase family protein [Pseudodesulfovibrio senegalensis]KAB1441783.1 hypothetical protein F8A88_09340 [Pseudodesulfovibrio senegalensis]